MGREPDRQDPVFHQALDQRNTIAGDIRGCSVSGIVYERPLSGSERLDRLSESSVALLSVSHALAMSLLEPDVTPSACGVAVSRRRLPLAGLIRREPRG